MLQIAFIRESGKVITFSENIDATSVVQEVIQLDENVVYAGRARQYPC
jgi:hypothetical protein